MFNNKLQVAQNPVKKGWKGKTDCLLCFYVESVDHISFKCHIANLVVGQGTLTKFQVYDVVPTYISSHTDLHKVASDRTESSVINFS